MGWKRFIRVCWVL